MAESGYDPLRSNVSDDTLQAFIKKKISGDLNEVPGIGRAAVRKLNENGISTTFVLIGKFLTLKEENVQSAEHCDRFWYFLQSVGIDAYRSGIVQCIAMKVDTLFPGIYDGSFYE